MTIALLAPIGEIEIVMTEKNTIQESGSKSASGAKSNLTGCFTKAVVGFVLLAITLFVVQYFVAPDVEDDKTVDIRPSQGSGSSVETDKDENPGSNSLAESITMKQVKEAKHPLDPLMTLADKSLEIIDSKFFDYSAKMLSQVRTGDTLHEENLMFVKVRHDRTTNDAGNETKIPFSIYTRFLKPKSKVGQEAIWVRGKEDEKILGHGTGILNFKIVRLDPEGSFAMSGNRYPIYQIGFRNLIVKMKEFGENDRKYEECDVEIDRGIEVDGRPCTLLTITHPKKRDHFDYHIAKIYIDNEYEIPTGYEGYLWPEKEGEEAPLLEKYFYLDLKLNCEFKDIDFQVNNPEYDYPGW